MGHTEYFDLSQPVQNNMSYYPGDPKPEIVPAVGVELPWRVSSLHVGTHTGTHIDAASHFVEGGRTIDQYPVRRFILPGICLPVKGPSPDETIERHHLVEYLQGIPKGGAVVIHTGWDRYWGQELYLRHPFLAPSAAQALAEAGVSLVGIDALNVDSTSQGTTHAHERFLGSDILIVENLRGLEQLPAGEVLWCSFLPLSLPGLDGSPVRAIAWKQGLRRNHV